MLKGKSSTAGQGRAAYSGCVMNSATGAYITAEGKKFLNFASTNFLGIANAPEIKVNHTTRSPCAWPVPVPALTKYGTGERHKSG